MSSSSSSSSPSFVSESEEEAELIPSLPNDIALNILARVPRSSHRTLSLVSKPIRSLLLSPRFFNARLTLHSTEPIFYLTSSDTSECFYALYRNPFHPNLFSPFRIPPIPSLSYVFDSAFAAVGPSIYVIGGTIRGSIPRAEMTSFFCYGRGGIPSPEVWVLDCRFNRWEQGPTMLTARSHAIASVANGKFFLIWGDDTVKCDEIEVNWNGDGELLATICSTHEIVSLPRRYAKQHCVTVFV